MNKLIRHRVLLISLAFLFFFITPVFAQERIPTPSDDEVNAVARDLFCPVCEHLPLDDCGTQACIQWRELIREQLAQGRTPTEIQQYFGERYGSQVLAAPPLHGINLLLYWLPLIMVGIGIGLLIRYLHARRLKLQVNAVELSDEIIPYVERLEDELKAYRTK